MVFPGNRQGCSTRKIVVDGARCKLNIFQHTHSFLTGSIDGSASTDRLHQFSYFFLQYL